MGAKCRSQCKRGYGAVQQVRTAASPTEITAAKIQAITDAVQTAKTQIQTAQKTAEERRRNIDSLRATLLYNLVSGKKDKYNTYTQGRKWHKIGSSEPGNPNGAYSS